MTIDLVSKKHSKRNERGCPLDFFARSSTEAKNEKALKDKYARMKIPNKKYTNQSRLTIFGIP